MAVFLINAIVLIINFYIIYEAITINSQKADVLIVGEPDSNLLYYILYS